jgi:hypothetical protein
VALGKFEGNEIPDSITPFIGVRAWVVNKTLRNEERLFSVFKSGVNWPIGRKLEAKCIAPSSIWAGLRSSNAFVQMSFDDPIRSLPKHTAPFTDCTCGIYGLNSGLEEEEVTPWRQDAIKGIVLMWGRVIEGERGWRTQYAKPVALVIDSDEPSRVQLIERMASLYTLRTITDLEGEIKNQRKLQGV